MKHLRKFNESINIEDLKDILLELVDMGYIIGYTLDINKKNGYIYTNIIISKLNTDYYSKNLFTWNEIRDTILRLKAYLGDLYMGFKCSHFQLSNEFSLIELDINENTKDFNMFECIVSLSEDLSKYI